MCPRKREPFRAGTRARANCVGRVQRRRDAIVNGAAGEAHGGPPRVPPLRAQVDTPYSMLKMDIEQIIHHIIGMGCAQSHRLRPLPSSPGPGNSVSSRLR